MLSSSSAKSYLDDEYDDDDGIDYDDDYSDSDGNRKEGHFRGSVKLDTYKAYFEAAKSKIYVFIVFLVFVAAQIISSGTDYFLSEWYVTQFFSFFPEMRI